MSLQGHILDLVAGRRIKHRQSSIAVADDYPAARCVDANVVGVVAELYLPPRRVRVAFEQFDRPVPCVRHEERVGRGLIAYALWLIHYRKGADHATIHAIDYA